VNSLVVASGEKARSTHKTPRLIGPPLFFLDSDILFVRLAFSPKATNGTDDVRMANNIFTTELL
jgi:hypothetical protein